MLTSCVCCPPPLVEEDVGLVSVPVVRGAGTYGHVSAHFISRGLTATPGLDYSLDNGSVSFPHGQNPSYINISILDDPDR